MLKNIIIVIAILLPSFIALGYVSSEKDSNPCSKTVTPVVEVNGNWSAESNDDMFDIDQL